MKTIKIQEQTIDTLQQIKCNMKIDHHLKLKSYDEVIQFLYQYFLEATEEQDKKIIELAKEVLNDQSKK